MSSSSSLSASSVSSISTVLGLDIYLKREASWNSSHTLGNVSIFNIPSHLLVPASASSSSVVVNNAIDEELNEIDNLTLDTTTSSSSSLVVSGKTCRTCGLVFTTLIDQQAHFKSPIHIRNLKRKSIGLEPIMQHSDTNSNDNNDSNDSNDNNKNVKEDNDDEDDDDEDDDADIAESEANASIGEELKEIDGVYAEGSVAKTYTKGTGSMITFQRSDDSKWEFSMSSVLCVSNSYHVFDTIGYNPWRHLSELLDDIQNISKLWAIVIIRSGRFAGAVYDGNKVILHKVFRRYTVRAKAGGGQSSYDNQGRKAQSAGAMLRRYGEQALKEDVHNLIREWSQQLKCCSKILISVPKTMRSLLFEEDSKNKSNLLQRDDPRIISIPFMVGKPTLEEISSIHSKCTKVYFRIRSIDNSNNNNDNNNEEITENIGNSSNYNKPKKIAFEEPELPPLPECPISKELINACINCDEKLATSIIDKLIEDEETGVESEFTLNEILTIPDSVKELRTPLHIASEMGCSGLVYKLLAAGANPCHIDVRGRTAYFVAKDKAVRDSFRRYRGSSDESEEQWNWDTAGVPAPLTDELEKAQRDKEKEKKKRAKQRKKEQKDKDEKEASEAKKKLEDQEQELEKQKELTKLNAGTCGFCNKTLFGIKPLDIFDRRCCSSPCVLSLRRKLAADAALARFS